jgi:hypothetical protein
MRFLAFCGRHPWLRNGLVLIVVAVLFVSGVRLWTSVPPDAVHITVTHVERDPDTYRTLTRRVAFDRTIHDDAVAQRLQRDLAALPLTNPFETTSCAIGPPNYNDYALTWSRFGLPVEQASLSHPCGATWVEDGVFFHAPVNTNALSADIAAAIAFPTTASSQAG